MPRIIDLDALGEIAQTLRTHKTRTALAVLTVAWGVFMLVLLLGAGRGLQNGVELQFKDDAINRIVVDEGRTTMAYGGQPRGRNIRFENADVDRIREQVPSIDKHTARYFPGGDLSVTYGGRQGSFAVRAVHPDHLYLEKTIVTEGRYINELDLREKRKICVIGSQIVKNLFADKQAVGEWLLINDIAYQVVGVFTDSGSRSEEETIYLPITTAQLVYGGQSTVHQILYTVGDATYRESKASEHRTRELLAERYNFSMEDRRAVRIYNNLDEYKKITDLFYWVRIFVAVVGAGTVLTGILAVSNIMVISVAERRREIGIRKALGATPSSITGLVVSESLIITSVAGYLGLLASIGLLELLKSTIAENEYMYQPDVNTGVVVGVTVLVIIAGTLAGYLPARKAASINPVEALASA